jgi:hypothetical protein
VIVDNLLGKLEYVALRQLVNPPEQSTPSEPAASPATATGSVVTAAGASLPDAVANNLPSEEDPAPRDAPGAASSTAGGAPAASELPAYGGRSVSRRLSVKVQLTPDAAEPPAGDPQPVSQASTVEPKAPRRPNKSRKPPTK